MKQKKSLKHMFLNHGARTGKTWNICYGLQRVDHSLKSDPNFSLWLPQAHTIGSLSCHSISQKAEDTKTQNTQPLS